ncbi:MAG TPA: VWA domain-containing protein [Kofleriaceae bacterium]|nr:VWA domain-containing protein [Kofleriaceae bacterium]
MSQLARNILGFVRILRAAGLPTGPESMLAALRAAEAVDVVVRDQFYWALHAVLVHRPEDHQVFDEAFGLFFRDPGAPPEAFSLLMAASQVPRPPGASRRVSEALRPPAPPAAGTEPEVRVEAVAALAFSPDELLRTRDFEQMSADEVRRARAAAARIDLLVRPVRTRRFQPWPRGRLDLPRTIRDAMRTFGDVAPLRYRRRRLRQPPLVALCDISGSMGRYSEMLLAFLHAVSATRPRVHTFLFGTRLTNATRTLRHRDVDQALAQLGREVVDWGGGTRLGACLHEFNRAWSRRVLAQGAVVLLISDGLDRDPTALLAAEAERLHKSCRRLLWLNPLLRWEGFEPRAQGVRALLPHVDEHRPVHNLDSLEALARTLAAPPARGPRAARGNTPVTGPR